MNETFIKTMIDICDKKIQQKWAQVGISFYVFFKNKNTNPDLLFEMASRWIQTHQLDHFEKATKIKQLLQSYSFKS